jgi:Cu(I)/Ag(I) efflux system membrane fusion protein/cobalt-zinc-cadmium efflux system membrane fusion protein
MKQIVRVSSYSSRSERGVLRLWAGLALVALIAVAALIWWPEGEMTMDSVNSTGVDAAIEEHAHAESELYTCGMHPQVLSESPGTCPICQMDLTPVKVDRSAATEVASSGERKIKYWRAPMDPDFVSDSPGKSPMGMDLVPVYEVDAAESSDLAITISPVVVQNMGVRTAAVEKRAVAKTVRTVGSIDYDEQRVRDVTTKFDGWIEDLYADYTGQNIKKGMPLFSVYSPHI